LAKVGPVSRPVRVTVIGDAEVPAQDLDPADPEVRTTSRTVVTRLAAGRGRHPGDGPARIEVVVDGWRFEVEVEDAARAALRRRATREADAAETSGPAEIRAIIPGRVAAVRVTAGDEVEAGRTLLVVEAMKMQNELRAPRAGTVERVAVGEGETIENGDLLVVLA
jgi:biotin carboxyl carrier protein